MTTIVKAGVYNNGLCGEKVRVKEFMKGSDKNTYSNLHHWTKHIPWLGVLVTIQC